MAAKLLNDVDKKRKVPLFRVLRCPMVGHQASWCRMLCRPIDGTGLCGRRAPHFLRSKTQIAIERFKERRRRSA
jgi:hypothetical protein